MKTWPAIKRRTPLPKLTSDQIQTALKELPGWTLEEGGISRLYKFKDFLRAMEFVNRVAALAEADDHHPDILILYNKVRLTLSTHSEGGVTQKDIGLARKIDGI